LGFDDEKIGNDLTLRRQQGAKPRRPRRQLEHVRRDQSVEEIPGAVADHFDHATVVEEGRFHRLCVSPPRLYRKAAKNGREHADSRAILEKKHGLFEVRFDAR
jgi:hypothetical protein